MVVVVPSNASERSVRFSREHSRVVKYVLMSCVPPIPLYPHKRCAREQKYGHQEVVRTVLQGQTALGELLPE